tara:strand:+ start:182 stop:2023 length:1842 start_codon:yes stop_codon:yes gene_type:complete
MATYEEIYGKRVKEFDSDPTLDSSYEGQVWYDKSSGVNKSLVQIKAFSSGGNLSTGRRASGAMGTQNAGAIAGGQAAPAYVNNTEEYSGFTWASGGNINTARAFVNNGTVGTQTAGLIFGGESNPPNSDLANTEEYDGSSWSEQNDLNTARRDLGGCGIQTAALAFGGTSSPAAVTELYDGSSWTTSPGTLNTGRAGSVGAGTQTAALAIGGPSTVVESWDGSSWTNGPSLNFQLDGGAGASGISTDALIFGGRKPPGTTLVASSEQWDGSTWVTTPDMSTARRELMGMGTAQSGLACGGFTPPSFSAATEEYNSNINAITSASLSSGGNLSTARNGLGGAGLQDSGLGFGGYLQPGVSNATEEYGGSSWTSGGNLGTARAEICGSGTQTAAWANGGFSPSSGTHLNTEEYDGSSWTAVNNSNSSLRSRGDAGTQTAGLMYAGSPPGSNVTEEYNGTTWTVVNSMVGTAGYKKGWGTQTAATSAGNSSDGGPAGTSVTGIQSEDYDGTSWTANSSLNLDGRVKMTAGQTGSLGAATGGRSEPSGTVRSVVEEWDGTSWKSAATLSTARFNGTNGIGTKAAGLFAGGSTPSKSNATEEYTGETEVVTASTLTTS